MNDSFSPAKPTLGSGLAALLEYSVDIALLLFQLSLHSVNQLDKCLASSLDGVFGLLAVFCRSQKNAGIDSNKQHLRCGEPGVPSAIEQQQQQQQANRQSQQLRLDTSQATC